MMRVLAMLVVMGWGGWCMAAAGHAPAGTSTAHPETYPAVAHQPAWAGSMVVVIGIMFAAALVAGLLVRSVAPEEMPVTHSHDDPAGSAHGHGGHH